MENRAACMSPAGPSAEVSKNIRARAGFTLIELLVSIVILAIGCMVVIKMQTSGMNAGERASDLAVASFLAESQAEWIQTKDVNELQFMSDISEDLAWDGSECPAGSTADRCFARTTKAICFTPTSRSCEVSVQVAWTATDGEHLLVYDTVVSAIGF